MADLRNSNRRWTMPLQRDWNKPRNIDALLEYARRIRDRDALVVIATDEHALKERHVESICRIARTHPMVLIDVATINPFDVSHARVVLDGAGKRRVPAFLRRGNTAGKCERIANTWLRPFAMS